MQTIKIEKTENKIIAKEAKLDSSEFNCVCLDGSNFNDVSAKSLKITDANSSDIEIQQAQLGGAYFHGIGLPPEGHIDYDPNAKQRPLTFVDCDLNGSIISDCDLSNVEINNSNLTGMKINGVLVEELLKFIKD